MSTREAAANAGSGVRLFEVAFPDRDLIDLRNRINAKPG